MKLFLLLLAPFLVGEIHAATSIGAANRFSFGASIGWIDWRGDTNNGAVIGEFVCSGYVWAANAGWINLGNGTPANGIRYQNNATNDFGVNLDGLGNLCGFAWGAQIGWLNFTNRDATGTLYDGPKVDLLTGRLSGFVWSASCGWISLSNQFTFVQTDSLRPGLDTDGDGIPDGWERIHFGNLTAVNRTSDRDGDGLTDLQEYQADTDPLDATSNLRIASFLTASGGLSPEITWTSVPTRLYRIMGANAVTAISPWADIGLGLISPDAGTSTTRRFTSTNRYFLIQVMTPLSP